MRIILLNNATRINHLTYLLSSCGCLQRCRTCQVWFPFGCFAFARTYQVWHLPKLTVFSKSELLITHTFLQSGHPHWYKKLICHWHEAIWKKLGTTFGVELFCWLLKIKTRFIWKIVQNGLSNALNIPNINLRIGHYLSSFENCNFIICT